MSKVIWRIDELIERGQSQEAATGIAIAEQLERIADALEKQNAGKFVPEDSNGPCIPGPSQICSP